MNIELITIGKTNIRFIQEGIAEYTKRLSHYIPFSIIAVPDLKNIAKLDKEQQKVAEGEKMLSLIQPGDYVVLLDERGRQYTSVEFSGFIEKAMLAGRKKIIFIVGGPFGFSQEMYNRADSQLSLSKMTFNHEMVRLFFIEQVYRAMTILRGEQYHHE